MDNKNVQQDAGRTEASKDPVTGNEKNPFENNTSLEKDIEASQAELDNEQTFKEANTERD